ncbi:MAG: hypothetical protein WBE86_15075 [Candidatus Acidiferrales bacterium]
MSDPVANEDDWQTATDIVEDRVRGRLLNWIDKLANERFSGFAVMALDCILIECLYGLEHGEPSPKKDSARVYREFLKRARFVRDGFDETAVESFYCCIRNGIAHDNETRKGWLIEKSIPKGKILSKTKAKGYQLNRTGFHKAVVAEFQEYLDKVRYGNSSARQMMCKRMKDILKVSAPPPA